MLQTDPKKQIIDILTIIDYQDSKEQFAEQFMIVCAGKSLDSIVESLPDEKKDQLRNKITSSQSSDGLLETLREYIPVEQLQSSITKTAGVLFQDYIQTILPVLTEDQKTKLQVYLEQMGKQNAPNS